MTAALGLRLSAFGLLLGVLGREPSAESRKHAVEIKNFVFEPRELSISVGDTVVWVNRDAFLHSATTDSAAWSSPVLFQGDRWVFVATKAGRFPYHCAAHPVMLGVLTVKDAQR